MGEIIERRAKWIVAGIAAIGLALRIAAAQGALWLDEAWSAVMAHQVGTPLGVLLGIHHDNNHHLNSLWLQTVGLDAPPLLQRALSIASGTAAILVAAAIGARRSRATAIVAAILFALSPILVTYGSEARGYAPMLLALTIAVGVTDRWLNDPTTAPPATALVLATLIGMLANLTMLFGLAALIGWTAVALAQRHGARGAFPPLARLLGPATITATLVLAGILYAAGGKLAVGAVDPFTAATFGHALAQLIEYTLGDLTGILPLLAIAGIAPGIRRDRLAVFCAFAMVAFPASVALLQLPNAGNARYLLLTSLGVLLFATLAFSNAAAVRKSPTLAGLAILVALMLYRDWIVITDRRADPARAVAIMASQVPSGTDAAVERPRSDAILTTAAATAHYPLTIRQTCPAAHYLFIERDGDQPFPPAPTHCAASYREVAGDTVQGLSGTQWKLYRRSDR